MPARPQTDTTVLRWLVAAAFVVILNETSTLTAIPRLMADFGVSESTVQWISTVFLLTMAVVIPVTGWLLQQVTTRTAFLLAMSVFSLGTLLSGLAWTFPMLVVGRLVQASGTAVMVPLLMTTLMAVVPPRERGRVMGNVTLAMSVAPALGPTLSGAVLQVASWRWIFLAVLPIALVVTAGGLRHLTNVGERVPSRIDWASVVLAAAGFGALVYGLSELGVADDPTAAWTCLAVGVVGVAAFVVRQLVLQREDRPLLDLRTLRSRVFAVSLAAMAIGFLGMLGSMILLQFYLQDLRGLSPLQTGLLLMPGALLMGLLGPRVGRLLDRFGSRVLVRPGGLLVALGLTGFALTGADTALWMVLAVHVTLMVGLALLFTPLFTMALGSLPPHLYSHGSSLLGTCQQVAGAFGTALVVTVMASRAEALAATGVPAAEATLGGMHWSFGLAAALAVVVLGLVSTLPARVGDTDDGLDSGERDDEGGSEPGHTVAATEQSGSPQAGITT